jgi:hypothetical protein
MPLAIIKAGERWNDTGIDVAAGRPYRVAAHGRWEDWGRPYGPDGGPSDTPVLRLTAGLRRAPTENWFALIGVLDRDPATRFLIGAGRDWAAPRGGRLLCYANDAWLMYFNNTGAVTLEVTALPPR